MSASSPDPGCRHLEQAYAEVAPGTAGCVDCEAIGSRWVHLRLCQECGHVGCCDSSPNRHARAHFHSAGHPLVRSFEPAEEWFYCFADDLAFELGDAPPAPSHP